MSGSAVLVAVSVTDWASTQLLPLNARQVAPERAFRVKGDLSGDSSTLRSDRVPADD